MAGNCIVIEGARQNNLKNLSLRLPLNELIVITGVSGSGKSSLAFDTVYSEGQRRYVETFSSYARQFLDRMDKPSTDRIEGIPPAIAIDQTNPVRTSRSTVGTMTELADHLKLLFARAARLYCRNCNQPVTRDTPQTILERLRRGPLRGQAVLITFPVAVPGNFSDEEIRTLLSRQGYTRIHSRGERMLEVVRDRVTICEENRSRLIEDFDAGLHHGRGRLTVYALDKSGEARNSIPFSSSLHCPSCDIAYRPPTPGLFSFNSAVGACETCRGFGRTIGIDYDLVVPDPTLSLAEGAIKPWQTSSYRECQTDLLDFARRRDVPVDIPWCQLSSPQRRWVIDGEGPWEEGVWYGVKRFFDWLESKSYRMHIRVLLSRYRTYDTCPACRGARLKPEALLWRIGAPPGFSIRDLSTMSIDTCRDFFEDLALPAPLDKATEVLLGEIRSRLNYLREVGLGYLTLDRQSRTLSGGEVQRINLTTALGTSLVNTLFVLDEPSIGLHPRDIDRLVGILRRLRDAGNTLLVVEHDPGVIGAADRVIDLGPGPGEHGGRIVHTGSLPSLLRCRRSLTARYLSGAMRVDEPNRPTPAPATPANTLRVRGASEHNLHHIDVSIPLNRLVCITGVSGSGKSTLVEDICFRGIRRLKHRPVDRPGAHEAIEGHELIDDVVLVDQSSIGKTTRANPASYVGAWEPIRRLFASLPAARRRKYTAGTFSFNSDRGRCPSCKGNGFEHIEMQFLSDVYLRCPDCGGRRFRPEILQIVLEGGVSIADVLEMTVSEAGEFFLDRPEILRALSPLKEVGLDYLRLGQPVPTLSGGEAQRLKLARHLVASAGDTRRILFLFDEPTTGLHFHDIATLLRSLRALLTRGHSLVVIEHNMDVVRAADWIIDLGPEGGNNGGTVVCAGTPETVAGIPESHTGRALRAPSFVTPKSGRKRRRPTGRKRSNDIRISHAREHNLKNVTLSLPRDRLTVITGISGSGKSTVAFDILFAEGQRRYLESLNAYARQFVQPVSRPDVDAISGIPPTVAIEQRAGRGGLKSTVATVTELHHFLRLLFVKLGTQHCPSCRVPIRPRSEASITAGIMKRYGGKKVYLRAPLVLNRKGYYTALAARFASKGYDRLIVDGKPVSTADWPRLDRYREHTIELPVAELKPSPESESEVRAAVARALEAGSGTLYAHRAGSTAQPAVFSAQRSCPQCGRSFDEPDPRLFSFNSPHGWCPRCGGTGVRPEKPGESDKTADNTRAPASPARPCRACDGARLRPDSLAIHFRGKSIAEFSAMSVAKAEHFFSRFAPTDIEREIVRDIVPELRSRLRFLQQVGLGYLSLDRSSPTLSGGEAQRIRLASQLGSGLRGVCYILDEPTIGLHARDNEMLLKTLRNLKERGNTVVVVEHDETTIRAADHIVDLGPWAGEQGGRVVAQGTLGAIKRSRRSVTGTCLRRPVSHAPHTDRRRTPLRGSGLGTLPAVVVHGARLHNLKNIRVAFPVGRLICVTGVSGSGKSTLVRDVLHDNLARMLNRRRRRGPNAQTAGCRAITGTELLRSAGEVDQRPIGRTPRSCPATYTGIWDEVRGLFARTPEAGLRGLGPSAFSFNVKGGRCEACGGQGVKKVEMSFLPDVTVTCERCGGARFEQETLEIRFNGMNVADILSMSVDRAARFFSFHPALSRTLELLRDVGLGYLTLGRQSPTLSGGEAQRIKLVTELAGFTGAPSDGGRERDKSRLYVLDEPTVGLHMADVEKLVRVLHRLVDRGCTVVVIEHNMDVIAEADWVIDLGPEAGDGGGRVVAHGTPARVARCTRRSHTAKVLTAFLRERNGRRRRRAASARAS